MNENFKPIVEALVMEGFHNLTEKTERMGKQLDFRITPYSLNSKLSFKFDSLEHFVEFLKMHNSDATEKTPMLQAALMELDLDPKSFFYVNFFEKGKEEEM